MYMYMIQYVYLLQFKLKNIIKNYQLVITIVKSYYYTLKF